MTGGVFDHDVRRTTGLGGLVRLGFADPAAADRFLTAAGLWRDGRPADAAAAVVVEALADAADPDVAAQALQRLVHAANDDAELRSRLCASEGFRRRLFGVLGASVALGDHLARHPQDWHVLADDDVTTVRPSVLGLQALLAAAVAEIPALPALQRAYRRCLLGLAARDLSGQVAVEDVAGELADLAAATLAAGLLDAHRQVPQAAALCRLAVVGMGKAGGRELNYVSDVDVVFVAEPVEGVAEEEALRAATALAGAMMATCAAVAWPVDAALRPEGRSGPLVRTLASHETYYRRWARTWEFQALLKARPLAGDLLLGQQYVDALAPLVWRAAERDGFVEDVQAMRRRVEASLDSAEAGREVKLGPGGLRDIEFAVQLLQLVHGRTDDAVRSGTTLVALERLAAGGYVAREDARQLAEAYRWLRGAEHRLQLARLRRTHLFPAEDDERGLRRLARSMGYRGDAVAELLRDRAAYGHRVRRLHEKLFYRPVLSAVARLPSAEARLSPAAAQERLQALGFAEPAVALRHLEALTKGVSRRATIQQTLLPVMLGWFADAADPDAGLLSFRQVSEALGSTPWFLRLLRDEGSTAERLAHLLASSRYVADLLGRTPEAVRLLADDEALLPRPRAALETAFLSAVRRYDSPEEAVTTARGLRRQELLRISCAHLLGVIDPPAVGTALSDVAGATVAAALDVATRGVAAAQGPLPMRLAVIAMGRLGGQEQGYGSDADVLFVHEPAEGATDSEAAAAAHEVANEMRRLLALPALDLPLVVDADLRPEGRQGPLTRSLASYVAYYARWSHVWEAQALLRARPLAGDADLGTRFIAAIDPVRWPSGGLPEDHVREIRRIKARVEQERTPRTSEGSLALKLGKGGLADVEWTVQLLQLRHAADIPGLRTTATLPALSAARAAGLLSGADADVLREAWQRTGEVRDLLWLVRGRAAAALPSSGRELAGVARLLGYPAGAQGSFLDDFRRTTRRARAVVERVFYA